MVCLGNDQSHSAIFEIAPKYCISDSFVDYEGYSISSKAFLPTVMDIIIIWIICAHYSPKVLVQFPKMLMFALAISSLTTTSKLAWFMDLTFQVPMQYCSLQHQTWLSSAITSTTRCCFCFGSVSSFFLELFLHSFPVAYWTHTDLGGSSFSVLSFCLFILFMGFSRQEYWSGLPFPSPVDHVLSELSTMTRLFWIGSYEHHS